MDIDIGGLIRAHRKRNNLTLTELQQRTGINNGSLSKIERNKQSLTNETILQLAIAFNVSLPELFTAEKECVEAGQERLVWRDIREFKTITEIPEDLNIGIGTLVVVQAKQPVDKGERWALSFDEPFVCLGTELRQIRRGTPSPGPENLVRWKVADESMEPRIFKDDDVLLDLNDHHIPRQGGIYAVMLGGEITLRKLKHLPGQGLALMCENRDFLPMTLEDERAVKRAQFQLIGHVVKCISTNGF